MSVIIAPTDIGSAIEPAQGVTIQNLATSAADVAGTGIDRVGGDVSSPYESCVLVAESGVASPAPTGYVLKVRLQHSDTSGSGYADYTDPTTGNVAQVSMGSASTKPDSSLEKLNINLKGAKQFIRAVLTATFTGGSSPAVIAAAQIILGGAAVSPTP